MKSGSIYGDCISNYTKIKNKRIRSEMSPACMAKENKQCGKGGKHCGKKVK